MDGRSTRRQFGAGLIATVLTFWSGVAAGISLDKDGTITFGLRTYGNTRVGTQNTNRTDTDLISNATFPYSPAGHVRQMRYFVEAEMDHKLDTLVQKEIGPLGLIKLLPFRARNLSYHLTYRGEGDMIYNWGPREYSTAEQFKTLQPAPFTGLPVNVGQARQELRDVAQTRNRLFQAYGQVDVGDFFIRFGRQILSWGETDVFRLLDNINPLDNSFGGFLISLDERRVPLDMLRVQYFVGDFGFVTESFIEGYAAIDNHVGYSPQTPSGSPWTFPNLGAPNSPQNTTKVFDEEPARTIQNTRGGARLVWNMFDATFSLANYFTYIDLPGVQVFVTPRFPNVGFSDDFLVHAFETAPKVMVSGASTTFAVPSLYSVVRSEFAYMNGEPRYTQFNIDPFSFAYQNPAQRQTTGGRLVGDSVNYVLGLDINRYIRFLNPNQTFLISTQFFWKGLLGVADPFAIRGPRGGQPLTNREVLPVPAQYIDSVINPPVPPPVRPIYAARPTDTFINTLLISTSYRSSTIEPQMVFVYDWGGAFLYQPSVIFRHDPFRFAIDFSIIQASSLKGGSGIALYQDRDNIQFRLEYVL